jgi:hypothetical protein
MSDRTFARKKATVESSNKIYSVTAINRGRDEREHLWT